jgi:hypothetical protein
VAAPEDAAQLVRAAYTLAELLGGEPDALAWIAEVGGDARDVLPASLTPDNQAVIVEELEAVGAVVDGKLESRRLADVAEVLRLAPLMRAAEDARRPAPTSRIVCTVPPEVVLPPRARHIQRSLAMLVADSLRTPGKRVLLAAPYWSRAGTEKLLGAVSWACEHDLPITIAGARREDPKHHAAMIAFAHELWARTPRIEVFTFYPPRERSLFHAKIVAGKRGYLGTGNLSIGGFEDNVEVGLPLDETDVERVWWLIERLIEAELLKREELFA